MLLADRECECFFRNDESIVRKFARPGFPSKPVETDKMYTSLLNVTRSVKNGDVVVDIHDKNKGRENAKRETAVAKKQ